MNLNNDVITRSGKHVKIVLFIVLRGRDLYLEK